MSQKLRATFSTLQYNLVFLNLYSLSLPLPPNSPGVRKTIRTEGKVKTLYFDMFNLRCFGGIVLTD